jgi:hypothetical protein
LHRITDNRISGSLRTIFRVFESLCGPEAMPNVVIATTMWSEVRQESGARREAELTDRFWKDLLDAGCKVERFLDTYDSAWDIIGRPERDCARVQLSHEIVECHLKLEQTKAGITLHDKAKTLLQDRKIAARILRTQTKTHFPTKQPVPTSTTKDDKIIM